MSSCGLRFCLWSNKHTLVSIHLGLRLQSIWQRTRCAKSGVACKVSNFVSTAACNSARLQVLEKLDTVHSRYSLTVGALVSSDKTRTVLSLLCILHMYLKLILRKFHKKKMYNCTCVTFYFYNFHIFVILLQVLYREVDYSLIRVNNCPTRSYICIYKRGWSSGETIIK